MKMLIIIACMLFGSAHAGKCSGPDSWRGDDKELHAIGGAVIAMGWSLQTSSPWRGFLAGAAVGVAHELLDATGVGRCTYKDAAVTMLGAAAGAGLAGLVVRLDSGAVVVSYSARF